MAHVFEVVRYKPVSHVIHLSIVSLHVAQFVLHGSQIRVDELRTVVPSGHSLLHWLSDASKSKAEVHEVQVSIASCQVEQFAEQAVQVLSIST